MMIFFEFAGLRNDLPLPFGKLRLWSAMSMRHSHLHKDLRRGS